MQKIGEAMAKAQPASEPKAGEQATPEGQGKDDNIKDADYKEAK
jgi:hypothetical protein